MTTQLNLMDIQGNLVRAYGRFHFPVARYVFLRVHSGKRGRQFVADVTKSVTTAANWGSGQGEIEKPTATINIAFTYAGLEALDLPRASLAGFPPEFAMGMKSRRDILGDDGPSAPLIGTKPGTARPCTSSFPFMRNSRNTWSCATRG